MPRIQAPTVAEHRARQRRAILDAARALLVESGEPPSLAAVGARAGLARSSVYEYFSSRGDLLAAVVADVLPARGARIVEAVDAATTPGARVLAYVTANMEMFAGSEQAVARALTKVVDPAVLVAPMEQFHQSLREPLLAALRAHGEPQPELMADIIGSMVVRSSRDLWSPNKRTVRRRLDAALELLRGLLDPYLKLPAAEADPCGTSPRTRG